MKLSMENYEFRTRIGDYKGAQVMKDAGFECMDYSYYYLPDDSPILGDGYLEYARDLRAHLDSIGIQCNQAHAPFAIRYGEEFTMNNKNYRDIVRAIESAAILGAKSIVVHAITVPLEKKDTVTEYAYEFYKTLEPYCAKAGIRIAVENLFSRDTKRNCYYSRLGDPKVLCDFIRSLNSPWFVACVDVGHAALMGYEPEDFIRAMDGQLLQALHIQDGDYIHDSHTLPFLGQYNWAAIIAALREKNYQGELTFETLHFSDRFPDALLPDAMRLAERTGRYILSL